MQTITLVYFLFHAHVEWLFTMFTRRVQDRYIAQTICIFYLISYFHFCRYWARLLRFSWLSTVFCRLWFSWSFIRRYSFNSQHCKIVSINCKVIMWVCVDSWLNERPTLFTYDGLLKYWKIIRNRSNLCSFWVIHVFFCFDFIYIFFFKLNGDFPRWWKMGFTTLCTLRRFRFTGISLMFFARPFEAFLTTMKLFSSMTKLLTFEAWNSIRVIPIKSGTSQWQRSRQSSRVKDKCLVWLDFLFFLV